jgi:hypothetical protein
MTARDSIDRNRPELAVSHPLPIDRCGAHLLGK